MMEDLPSQNKVNVSICVRLIEYTIAQTSSLCFSTQISWNNSSPRKPFFPVRIVKRYKQGSPK